jgi:hypothetical protein
MLYRGCLEDDTFKQNYRVMYDVVIFCEVLSQKRNAENKINCHFAWTIYSKMLLV